MVPSPSGKAKVCNTFIPRFKSGWYLQKRAKKARLFFRKRVLFNFFRIKIGGLCFVYLKIQLDFRKKFKIFALEIIGQDLYMLVWRNGRRTGLKILSSQGRVGSTPTTSTNEKTALVARFQINLKSIAFRLFFHYATKRKSHSVTILSRLKVEFFHFYKIILDLWESNEQ